LCLRELVWEKNKATISLLSISWEYENSKIRINKAIQQDRLIDPLSLMEA